MAVFLSKLKPLIDDQCCFVQKPLPVSKENAWQICNSRQQSKSVPFDALFSSKLFVQKCLDDSVLNRYYPVFLKITMYCRS